MPQVVMQQPQDLNSLFGATSALPGYFGAGQIQQANVINQQNLASAVQAAQIEKEQAPATLAEMQARTGLLGAQAGHLGAQTQGLNLENQVNGAIPLEQRVAAKRAELASKMSDAEIKQHENEIQKMLFDPDPVKQAVGQKAWEQISLVKQEKMKQDAAKEQAKSTATILAESRRDVAGTAANAKIQEAILRANSLNDRTKLMVQNKAMTLQQAHTMYAGLAMTTQDPAEAAHYKAMADYYQQADQGRGPPPQPQVNPAAIGGGVLQPAPRAGVTPMPPGRTVAPAAPTVPFTPTTPTPQPGNNVIIPSPNGPGKLPPGATQQDVEAYEWAIRNPDAPNSKAIKAKAAKILGLPE